MTLKTIYRWLIIVIFALVAFSAIADCWHCQPPEQDIVNYNVVEQSIQNEVNRYGSASSGAIGGHQFYWGKKSLKWSGTFVYDDETDKYAGSFAVGTWIGSNISHFAISKEEGVDGYQYLYQMGGDF